MSSTSFDCIICDLKTDSLLSLQEHTRTHASINKGSVKCKVYNNSTKAADQIPCDICQETFDTPTKAISHKFKKHPNATDVYFCPFCGKQFPIKYILDKHKTSHTEGESDKVIPCEHCDALFFNVNAAKYHNTYFHKKEFMLANFIQTPPASLKIIRGSAGDFKSAYYCQFCGNEYALKYNLQQHIKRLHMKMQALPPENLIKCKSCAALFYTVEAYEFHTSFHSNRDLFVDSEEARQQIVSKIDNDFDVRRVKVFQQRPKNAKHSLKMQEAMSEIRDKLFADIGNMSSLSPPPSDSESDQEENDKEQDAEEEPAENAITINQLFEMNKSILGDCIQDNMNDIEIKGEELVKTKTKRKNNSKIVKENHKKNKKGETNENKNDLNETKDMNDEVKCLYDVKSANISKDTSEQFQNCETLSKEAVHKLLRSKHLITKYGSFKFLDLKVHIERTDLEVALNRIMNVHLSNVKSEGTLNVSPDLKAIKSKNDSFIDSFSDRKTNIETGTIKTEPSAIVVPDCKSIEKCANIPKNLIPVSSIPSDVKSVKVFKKVMVPKGMLKPGVKVLSKRELEDLMKKGLVKSGSVSIDKSIENKLIPPNKKIKIN